MITLKSMKITLEALVGFSYRFAELALKMAEEENDPVRKKELLEISEICRHVPANPARTVSSVKGGVR